MGCSMTAFRACSQEGHINIMLATSVHQTIGYWSSTEDQQKNSLYWYSTLRFLGSFRGRLLLNWMEPCRRITCKVILISFLPSIPPSLPLSLPPSLFLSSSTIPPNSPHECPEVCCAHCCSGGAWSHSGSQPTVQDTQRTDTARTLPAAA